MTIKHRIKLIPSRVKWVLSAIDVVIRNRGRKVDKIENRYKEIKERYLFLDKQIVKKERHAIAKAEYELISYIRECLKG